MKKSRIVALSFFLCILITCSSDDQVRLDEFLPLLESQIVTEALKYDIRSYPYDSLDYLLPIFRSHCQYLLDQRGWSHPIEESYVKGDSYLRDKMLLWAFQKYLNGEGISLQVILNEIRENEEQEEKEKLKREERENGELVEIIRKNNQKFAIGDTLTVILQIDVDQDYRGIIYQTYPKSLDYSSAEDSIFMKGELLDKYYDRGALNSQNSEAADPLDLVFVLKVLDLSEDGVYNFAKEIRVGDMFHLHLELYARSID